MSIIHDHGDIIEVHEHGHSNLSVDGSFICAYN
jgi:hypothetical protein